MSAAKEARLAARRASVAGTETPSTKPPPSAPAKPRSRVLLKAFAVLLAVVGLGVGGWYGNKIRYERSDAGRAKNALLAWEFAPRDPAARDRHFAEIDRMGVAGVRAVVELLGDASLAEKGSSQSTRSVRELANAYLLHYAAVLQIDPPPKANEIVKTLFEGGTPAPDQWAALQAAWRAWLDDVVAKGATPKA